jgi:HEAT repeat protein
MIIRRLAAVLFFSCLGFDEVDDAKKVLADKAYGNYWDRLDACRKLGGLGTVKAAQALADVLNDDESAIREAAVLALARALKTPDVRTWVDGEWSKFKDASKRANALWAMRQSGDAAALTAGIAGLADANELVREQAARLIEVLGGAAAAEPLEKALKDASVKVRSHVYFAYAKVKGAEAVAKLEAELDAKEARLRAMALVALATASKDRPTLDQLTKAAKDKDPEVRMAAGEACSPAGGDDALTVAKLIAEDKDWRVRVAAIEAAEASWNKEAIPLLIGRLAKEDGRLRLDLLQALQHLTGKEIGSDPKAWKSWWEANGESFQMPAKPTKGKKAAPAAGMTRATFFNLPLMSKRIAIIIDVSGSMKNDDEIYKGKRKIDVALEELEKAVKAVDDDAKLTILALSTEATVQKLRTPGPKLIDMAGAGRTKLMDFIKNAWKKLEDIKRGRGDIYDAVIEAASIPDVDTVILLSDGRPTYGTYSDREHFVEGLREFERFSRVAVHTVLTGSKGIDRELMERSAEVTRGVFMERN